MTLATGVVLIAPAQSKPVDEPASPDVRWGLLVDTSKCEAGCSACVDACREEQGWEGHGRPEQNPQWIRKVDLKETATGRTFSLPVMCQHCTHPPCVDVCPTGASFKRADGIVLVDRHICIGCRYCMMACPYKARSFVHEDIENQKPHMPRGKGCVEACTLCVHRIDAGGVPACVEKCGGAGTGAMLFGDLNDPNAEISKRIATYATTQIRPDLKLNPGVFYQGL
ncbi:MAG: 4Fe-4S dicluster domain-containing protein [Alphaproteobacteria bacterium]|nr:4Fe-4S dicluster domain-containing protein [Alphaproteobacteria bacterium]MBF0128884.1 4Fe-4S dicluster domain-containing protein [Alphaproteobacteria bacterium]